MRTLESGSSGIVVFKRVDKPILGGGIRGEAVVVGVLARDFSQGGSLCGSSGEAGFRSSILDGPRKSIRLGARRKLNIRDYLFDAGLLSTCIRMTVSFSLSQPQGHLTPQLNRHHVGLASPRRRTV